MKRAQILVPRWLDLHELVKDFLHAGFLGIMLSIRTELFTVTRLIAGDRNVVEPSVFMKSKAIVSNKEVLFVGHQHMLSVLSFLT